MMSITGGAAATAGGNSSVFGPSAIVGTTGGDWSLGGSFGVSFAASFGSSFSASLDGSSARFAAACVLAAGSHPGDVAGVAAVAAGSGSGSGAGAGNPGKVKSDVGWRGGVDAGVGIAKPG